MAKAIVVGLCVCILLVQQATMSHAIPTYPSGEHHLLGHVEVAIITHMFYSSVLQ